MLNRKGLTVASALAITLLSGCHVLQEHLALPPEEAELTTITGSRAQAAVVKDELGGQALIKANHRAAEALLGSSSKPLSLTAPITMGPLTNINKTPVGTRLGAVIASQLTSHIAKEGYTMSDPSSTPDNLQAVITGTFALSGNTVLVTLQLTDPTTKGVIGAHDYVLVLDPSLRRLIAEH